MWPEILVGAFSAAATPTGEQVGWLDYLGRIGVVAFLVISHYGFHKGWWVYGTTHKDLALRHELLRKRLDKTEDELQAWKEQALTGQRIAERSATIAEAAMSRGQRGGR